MRPVSSTPWRFHLTCAAALVVLRKVVAQALGLALAIGAAVAMGVQVFGPAVLVQLAGEKSKEVSHRCTCIVRTSVELEAGPTYVLYPILERC